MTPKNERYLYFSHDWIWRIEQANNVSSLWDNLFSAAEAFEIRLWLQTLYTVEGLLGTRITARAPSGRTFANFVLTLVQSTTFVRWTETSLESGHPLADDDFDNKLSNPREWERALASYARDGIWNGAMRNERIIEKLETKQPLYFAYDWTPPDILPDWVAQLKWPWQLQKEYFLAPALHFVDKTQFLNGGYGVRFAISVYAREDLDTYRGEIEPHLGVTHWIQISSEEFMESTSLAPSREGAKEVAKRFQVLIEEISQLNKEAGKQEI